MTSDEPVQVFSAWNSVQAHFVRNLLADEGIPARVASDAIQAISGEVPFQKASCPVWVDAADEERARALVAEYESRLAKRSPEEPKSAEPFCYHCGQSVTVGQSPCPSCGIELDWSE